MAEQTPNTGAFDKKLKVNGIPVQDILDGKAELKEAGFKKEFQHLFENDPDAFKQMMNAAGMNANEAPPQGPVPIDQFLGNRKKQSQAEVRQSNLQTLDDIYRSIQQPALSQQMNTSRVFAMTPISTQGGTPVFNAAAEAEKLIGYYASQGSRKKQESRQMNLAVIDDVMNSQMLPGFNGDGTVRFQGGAIWGQANSGINGNSYGNFSTNTQGTIEAFHEFTQRVNNPRSRGRGFVALDIETFGSMGEKGAPDEWFHISEVAASHYDYDKRQKGLAKKESFSWFAKPSDALQAEMQATIAGLQHNPAGFQALPEAKQRTLLDLMLYSTAQVESNNGFAFKPAGFERVQDVNGLNVIHSNIKEMDSLFTPQGPNHQVITQNFAEFATHMQSGLANMNRHGQTLDAVMGSYNGLVDKHKSKYFVTFNGNNFDVPGLERFGGQSPARHLDWLAAGRTVANDPFELQQFLGRADNLAYEQGAETLYEWRRSVGLNTNDAHLALADVGDDGLGGIVLKTMDKLDERIQGGAAKTGQAVERPASGLAYDNTPLKKGQMLFALKGVSNYSDTQGDFQGQYIDGKLQPAGRPGDVLNAESFYQFTGVRKVKGQDKYVMELFNPGNETVSYIMREGARAREELAEFIHHNLRVADDMTSGGQNAITGLRETDLARRRFDGLFGLQQGATKGYQAAQRMFSNVDVFREQFSGSIDELTDADRAALTEKMNFNTLFNPQTTTMNFNASEAEQFWHMLPRLDAERDAFGVAMERIEQAVPFNADKPTWAQRDDNILRSLMLKEFNANIEELTGGGQVSTRATLPYERHILSFQDRASGRERTLNLHDPSTAAQQVKNYIYSQHNEFKGDAPRQKQIASERYLTLLTSLQESGYMDRGELNNMTNEFLQNPGASPSAFGDQLAYSLVTNEDILAKIERTEITEKSIRANDAVRNLELTDVLTAADNGVSMGMDVRGAKAITPGPNGRHFYEPAYLTGKLKSVFDQLDHVNDVTKLNPNNQRAVEQLLTTFMNQGDLSHGVGFALTAKADNSAIFINLFDEADTSRVLGALTSNEVPHGVVRVALPTISENGTMRHQGMVVNANSDIVRDPNSKSGFRKASSVERLAESFAGDARRILKGVHDPTELDISQKIADRRTMNGIQELSGTKRHGSFGENDTYKFKNTTADIAKQSHVDVAPAIIHEMHAAGLLKTEGYGNHLNPSAFDHQGNLKIRFDYDKDITLSMKELVSRNALDWAERNKELLGGDADLSFVKEEKAWNTLAMTSGRRSIPFGEFGPHTRPNITQNASAYPIPESAQARVAQAADAAGVYLNFDTLASTPEVEAMRGQLSGADKPYMNLKLSIMSDQELQRRNQALYETAEGRGVLERTGMLNADGSYAPEKAATLYEQQIVINRALLDNMHMERTQHLDVDKEKSLLVAQNLIDADSGDYRIGATVRPGEVIGLDGNGKQVRFKGQQEGTIVMDDGRVAIKYQEQVHKAINDIEKGTFSAGAGFTSEYMEAVTGIKGTGAIIDSDFAKHGDFHHLLRGHLNRIGEELRHMDGPEFEEKKAFLENFFKGQNVELGLRVIKDGSDLRIEESVGKAGVQEITDSHLQQLLKGFGLTEMQTMGENKFGFDPNTQTLGLIQSMGWADVSNYSTAAGEEDGHVRYGPREIGMLRRQGLHETANAIEAKATAEAKLRIGNPEHGGISDYNRGMGMLDSFKALSGQVTPDENDRIFTANDFRPAPEVDKSRATHARTINDSNYVQQESRYNAALSKHHGFWFQLPELPEGVKGLEIEGRPVSQLLIPHQNLAGAGNEVFKTDHQRINERIVERAREVEAAKQANASGHVDMNALGDARNRLQGELSSFHQQLRMDLTSSRGHMMENVLKVQLPHSASGIAKIVSPAYASEMGSSELFISPMDARAMGIEERLSNGDDLFAKVLRNPTFHDQALQVARIRIGEHLLEGQQEVTSILAANIRADSDGDQLRTAILTEDRVQAELGERYATQDAEQAARLNRVKKLYDQASDNALEDLLSLEGKHVSYAAGGTDDFSFAHITGGSAKAQVPADAVVAAKESYAKFGKQIIGMASNLNYRYTQMAEKYFDKTNPNELAAYESVRDFFEGPKGLEQRIISAKNDKLIPTLETRHGGLELIEALQARRFQDALAIDQSPEGLGGYFTENAGMARAIPALQMLEERAGEGMRGDLMGFGLAGGVNGTYTDAQILDAIGGEGRNRPDANPVLQSLSRLNNTEVDVSYLYDAEAERPVYGNPPNAGVATPAPSAPAGHTGQSVNEMRPNYSERGAGRIGSAINDALGSKYGKGAAIAGAVGLGALMLTNLTRADSLSPESRPHNDETIHSSNPGAAAGQSARVEMNGSGYNGLRVSVSGQGPGHYSNEQIGALTNGALQSSGISTNVNIRSQDDTSVMDQQWVQQQFTELINNG